MSSAPTTRRAQTRGNLSVFPSRGQLTARRSLVVSRITSSGCGRSSNKLKLSCIVGLYERWRLLYCRVPSATVRLRSVLKIAGMIFMLFLTITYSLLSCETWYPRAAELYGPLLPNSTACLSFLHSLPVRLQSLESSNSGVSCRSADQKDRIDGVV